jgi:hypothetical protein
MGEQEPVRFPKDVLEELEPVRRYTRTEVLDIPTLRYVASEAQKPALVLWVDEVRTGTQPLWIVEGATRAAALAGFGIPAVAIPGVWNWQKAGEPSGCWHRVNLRAGRDEALRIRRGAA